MLAHQLTVLLLIFAWAHGPRLPAQIVNGNFTTTIGIVGSVDFEIDLDADTLTLSNQTGEWATFYGPSQASTFLALDDLTNPASTFYNPTTPTHDVTESDTATWFDALAMAPDDGWYWASETSDSYFHVVLGGENNSALLPISDYGTSTSAAFTVSTASNANTSMRFDGASGSLVPEPGSSLLAGVFGLGLLLRRKRA